MGKIFQEIYFRKGVEMNNLISVIIPVYNKEDYISDCVNSVLNQTYENYEIIIVDDGSTDNSYDICKDYSNRYKCVRLFHQANNGPAAARNFALQHSSGEYVVFLDADDWLEQDYLYKLNESDGDLVISGYKKVFEDSTRKIYKWNDYVAKKDDFPKYIFCEENMNLFVGPCLKLFRRDIIQKYCILFPDIRFGEDTAFVFQYLKYCNDFCVIDYAGYINRIIPGTLSRKKVPNVWEILLKVEKIAEETFSLKDTPYWSFFRMRSIKISLSQCSMDFRDFKYTLSKIKRNNFCDIKISDLHSLKDKIIYFLLSYSFTSFALFVVMHNKERKNNA